MDDKQKRKLVRWCDARLKKEYGDKTPEGNPDPLDTLILTVLSQNTNDVNRDRAYKALRDELPSWEEVLHAKPAKVEKLIRPGGLAKQKSARIKAMLAEIKKREGKLDLTRVCAMPVEQGLPYLCSFNGVGEKTAAVVLLFACGKPVFPVDTHVLRLSRRTGLVPENTDATRAHRMMGELVEPSAYYRFHLNLIKHGRRICRARKPQCPDCCLKLKCTSAFGFET
ncbi:MAG: endonuclease III [bacterium]